MRTMLPWDDGQEAYKARNNGWRIDKDDWWTRKGRVGDVELKNVPHFGFRDSTGVYVRRASFANAYDQGKVL